MRIFYAHTNLCLLTHSISLCILRGRCAHGFQNYAHRLLISRRTVALSLHTPTPSMCSFNESMRTVCLTVGTLFVCLPTPNASLRTGRLAVHTLLSDHERAMREIDLFGSRRLFSFLTLFFHLLKASRTEANDVTPGVSYLHRTVVVAFTAASSLRGPHTAQVYSLTA